MSNPRIRGLVFLGVAGVAAWFFCVFLSFTALPGGGFGIGLPVITVPGEVIHYNWLPGFNLPNTLMGGFLATFLIALWAGLSYRSTNGWTREVPDRWQAWTEFIVEAIYGFLENLGGESFKKAPLVWPFAAAIFFFLLAGNLGKLLPGFETVGYIHCGYEGFAGYARLGEGTSGRLWVDRALDSGTTQTAETEEACQHQMKVLGIYYGDYDPADYAEERAAYYERLAAIGGDVPAEFASATPLTPDSTLLLTGNLQAAEEPEVVVEEVPAEPATGSCLAYIDGATEAAEEAALEGGELGAAEGEEADEAGAAEGEGEAEGEDHGEAGEADEADEAASDSASLLLTSTLRAEEGEEDHGEESTAYETVAPEVVQTAFVELVALEEAFEAGTITAAALEEKQCEVTRMMHPGAVFPLESGELQASNIQPYVFTVAPWFRGVSTDLSFNFGLSLLVVVVVQVYGVIALGPSYFEKFINLSAVGNAGKRPLGIVDFVVGIFEIVSELGKIISLAFRLFGNLFAGGIVLIVFSFLIAIGLPVIMLLLEVIIGSVQAMVFAVLLIVYTSIAMESHHGDDHDDHHDEAH